MSAHPFLVVTPLKAISDRQKAKNLQRELLIRENRLRMKMRRPRKLPVKVEPLAALDDPETRREQFKNLRLLMNTLERQGLLRGLSDSDLQRLEENAMQRVRGDLDGPRWLAILTDLERRRSLMSQPPKPVRKHFGTGSDGW